MSGRAAQPSRMLTPEDVADEFAISVEQVRRLIRRGELAAVNIGAPRRPTYRVSRASLDKFLRDHAVAS
jgi:excisionase family DNA binding protein